jgi:hypothetical protein
VLVHRPSSTPELPDEALDCIQDEHPGIPNVFGIETASLLHIPAMPSISAILLSSQDALAKEERTMTSIQPAESDTEQPAPGGGVKSKKPSPAARRWLWRGGLAAGAVALLLAGYLAGHTGKAGLRQSLAQARGQRNIAQAKLAETGTELSAARGTVAAAQDQAQKETTIAQSATQAAQKKAEAQYAGKLATVDQEQQQLAADEKTVKTEEGQLNASAISLSGVYVVGQDIKAGTWHTNGDGGGGLMSNDCYFATLNSGDTFDIADNNNFDGAETVDVAGAYAFEISGPCTWYYVG